LLSITRLLCDTPTPGDDRRYGERRPGGHPVKSVHHRPVVVWNVTRRCNLHCAHCYSSSQNRDYPDELTLDQGKALIDDLAEFGAPVLLFSGGEPVMRPDLHELVAHSRQVGLRPVLSTNGTLLSKENVSRLSEAGLDRVGISLDGLRAPDDFPFARYAANVGLALVTGKHWWQRTRVHIVDRPMLDFRPTEFRPKPFPVQATLTASMAAVMLLGLGGIYQFTSAQQHALAQSQDELAALERSVGLKELRVRRAADQRAEITKIHAETEALLDKVNLVKERERGYARVIDLVTDRVASIAGLDVKEIDDDGKIVGLTVEGPDFNSVLRLVRLLEAEPGFTDVRVRTVGAHESETEGDGTGTGIGISGPPGGDTGGILAAPGETGGLVTFNLSINRTPLLEAPVEPEASEEAATGSNG
jgi:hypothetical protein